MSDCYIVRRGGTVEESLGFPEFTYSGTYTLLDDGFADDGKTQNWRIKFLSSGVLKFTNLGSGKDGIAVFCVGGGGGGQSGSSNGLAGGGGGYTKTGYFGSLAKNKEYTIVVGAGGAANVNGGSSSAFGVNADGGECGGVDGDRYGGDGGSGGGAGGTWDYTTGERVGGSNGGAGGNGYDIDNSTPTHIGGTGQGTTTREFGESSGTLYSGGGGGGCYTGAAGGDGGGGRGAGDNQTAEAGTENLGGGGGGGHREAKPGKKGGAGIVVIRNVR